MSALDNLTHMVSENAKILGQLVVMFEVLKDKGIVTNEEINNKFIELGRNKGKEAATDESLELALFRSASWPYLGTPKGIVAKHAGHYRVRFSARAVLQQLGGTKGLMLEFVISCCHELC